MKAEALCFVRSNTLSFAPFHPPPCSAVASLAITEHSAISQQSRLLLSDGKSFLYQSGRQKKEEEDKTEDRCHLCAPFILLETSFSCQSGNML